MQTSLQKDPAVRRCIVPATVFSVGVRSFGSCRYRDALWFDGAHARQGGKGSSCVASHRRAGRSRPLAARSSRRGPWRLSLSPMRWKSPLVGVPVSPWISATCTDYEQLMGHVWDLEFSSPCSDVAEWTRRDGNAPLKKQAMQRSFCAACKVVVPSSKARVTCRLAASKNGKRRFRWWRYVAVGQHGLPW